MFIWQSDQRVREAYSLIFLCGIISPVALVNWATEPRQDQQVTQELPKSPAPMTLCLAFSATHTHSISFLCEQKHGSTHSGRSRGKT